MACSVQTGSFADHEREMEMQLSCSVCLELFTDPVILPCLHSLCRQCVVKMTDNGDVISQTFHCPECKAAINVGPGGHKTLKRNFPLSSMVAIYKQSTLKRPRSVLKPSNASTGQGSDEHPPAELNVPLTEEGPTHSPQQRAISGVPRPKTSSSPQTTVQTEQTNSAQPNDKFCVSGDTSSDQGTRTVHDDSKDIPTTCSTCEIGKPRKAAVYCETCTISFCQYCLDGYHPEGIGHHLIPVVDEQTETQPKREEANNQPVQCPLCSPGTPSQVRCLECEMSFCNECLSIFHPSTKTILGHTLVEMRSAPNVGMGVEGGEERTGAVAGGPGGSDRRRSGGQTSRHSGSSIDSISTRMDIGGLAQLAVKSLCSRCQCKPPQNAAVKCLDCSSYLCEGCVHGHQSELPSHSLIDIRLEPVKPLEPVTSDKTHTRQSASKPVNVQLKLVELMGIRAEAMQELLRVLEGRRASLEYRPL